MNTARVLEQYPRYPELTLPLRSIYTANFLQLTLGIGFPFVRRCSHSSEICSGMIPSASWVISIISGCSGSSCYVSERQKLMDNYSWSKTHKHACISSVTFSWYYFNAIYRSNYSTVHRRLQHNRFVFVDHHLKDLITSVHRTVSKCNVPIFLLWCMPLFQELAPFLQ